MNENNIVKKYAVAALALLIGTWVGISGYAAHRAAARDAGVARVLHEMAVQGPQPVTDHTGRQIVRATTGNNAAGWKIDPTSGDLLTPAGKVIEGLQPKGTVVAVCSSNVTTSGTAVTCDGQTLSTVGARVLATAETSGVNNGCYLVASGAWTRCPEMATGSSAAGAFYVAQAGTSNKGVWVFTNASGSDVVGTNALTSVNVAGGGGGGAVSSVNGLTGVVTLTSDTVGARNGLDIAAVTTKQLSAYTYANGTAGVGATITGNANQACDTIDGLTPTLTPGTFGSYTHVLVQNGAAFSDNGVYQVTQIGDGTHPCILTRDTRVDTPSEIRAATVHVTQGLTRRGAVYEYANDPNITIGTTALAWIRTDAGRGPTEYAQWQTNFDQQTTTPVTGTMVGEFPGFVTVSSGSINVVSGTATERGLFQFTTGATSASGNAIISFAASNRPLVIDSTQWFRMTIKLGGIPTLSNGTDTYRILAGIGDGISFPPSNGIWAEYSSGISGTSWIGVNRTSSTNTTATGQVAAITQYDTFRAVKYAGETSIHWYQDGVEMTSSPIGGAPIGTTISMTPYLTVQKTVGTTGAGTVNFDYYRVEQAWPNGNAT